MRLNVLNPYTNLDTLYINDYRNTAGENLKVPGPFVSGILYTADHWQILQPSYSGNALTVGYKINMGQAVYKSFPVKAYVDSEVIIDIQ